MSKARKQSRGEESSSEIFADDEFDAEDFVEHMDDKGASHKQAHAHAHAHTQSQAQPHSRGGWRRLEELREQKMLRDQLLDLKDWDELEEEP